MLRKCIYGGGDSCERQGGDGSLHHGGRFSHPFPQVSEAGVPEGEFVAKGFVMAENHELADFDIDFNEDKAHGVLSLEISKAVDVGDLIKSLYDFDLESEEGILKLMDLLPVLDSTIVVELVEKIWPGYAVENADPDLLRAEVKGFLLDYLNETPEERSEILEPTGLDGAEEPTDEGSEDEVPVADDGSDDGDDIADGEAADIE